MNNKTRSPWAWVPSLYFAEGIPYIVVMTLSVIFYKRMGISNTDIALYTSWLYLPWVIKPLWSPVVDLLKTKRWWIVIMQLVIGAGLAGVAFTVPVPAFFQYTLAFFWLLAFSSATHDIAADGFYLLGLSSGDQAYFVGIRSTFYRFAMLTGQGLLVILAGYLESETGLKPVRVEVVSKNIPAQEAVFTPFAVQRLIVKDEAYFAAQKVVEVSTENISSAKVKALQQQVEDWNIKHGFYSVEKALATKEKEPSWWSKSVAEPLDAYLKSKFRQKVVEKTDKSGNLGFIAIQLSQEPAEGEKVVLNFGYEKGDKSIQLAKTYRYEFSGENWQYPAFAIVKLDPKLKIQSTATFVGRSGNIVLAWSIVFFCMALLFVLFAVYHRFALPKVEEVKEEEREQVGFVSEFLNTFVSFFQKKGILTSIVFLLVYRLAESQIVKMASPFLLDAHEAGGLGLATGDLGLVYGTVGMIALTVGGILGGILASRNGLKYWIWWMALAINLPNAVYLLLAVFTPSSLLYISAAVAVEQFGYGFGFTAYMLYMIYISEGEHKTAHFAITTGFMALGMMIPGMISGWLQEIIGYQNFFVWVLICTVPGFLIIPFLRIDREFGMKKSEEDDK